MSLAHDHTIYLVPDPARLDAVCDRFRAAGFTVTEREDAGKESSPTAQRLICFEDGSYIEILTIRDPEARQRHRFSNLLTRGEGWADYSLVTDDLDGLAARLEAAGLPLSGPHAHARKLRDGRPWGVRLVLAGIGAGTPALPFVLEDTAGRELRIPRHATRHDNGIVGTAGVSVAAGEARSLASGLAAIGAAALPAAAGVSRFALSRGWIEAAEPAAGNREGMVSATFLKPGSVPGRLEAAEAAGLAGFLVTGSL